MLLEIYKFSWDTKFLQIFAYKKWNTSFWLMCNLKRSLMLKSSLEQYIPFYVKVENFSLYIFISEVFTWTWVLPFNFCKFNSFFYFISNLNRDVPLASEFVTVKTIIKLSYQKTRLWPLVRNNEEEQMKFIWLWDTIR